MIVCIEEDDDTLEPELVIHQEEEEVSPRHEIPSPQSSTTEEDIVPPGRPYTELNRNVVRVFFNQEM